MLDPFTAVLNTLNTWIYNKKLKCTVNELRCIEWFTFIHDTFCISYMAGHWPRYRFGTTYVGSHKLSRENIQTKNWIICDINLSNKSDYTSIPPNGFIGANDINKQNILSFLFFTFISSKSKYFDTLKKNKSVNYYIIYHGFVWAHRVESNIIKSSIIINTLPSLFYVYFIFFFFSFKRASAQSNKTNIKMKWLNRLRGKKKWKWNVLRALNKIQTTFRVAERRRMTKK